MSCQKMQDSVREGTLLPPCVLRKCVHQPVGGNPGPNILQLEVLFWLRFDFTQDGCKGIAGDYEASCLPCRIPLPFGNNATPGYVEWLYLDEDLRITRGSKGSYFIHTRE